MFFSVALFFVLIVQFALLLHGSHLALPLYRLESLQLEPLILSSLSALLGTLLTCYLIKRFEFMHRAFTFDHQVYAVQKIHEHPVPRIGGVAIMVGLIISMITCFFFNSEAEVGESYMALLLLASLPIFLGGLVEDLTKKVRVRTRLLLAFISAGMGAYLLHALLLSLGVDWVDKSLINVPWVLLIFTLFAVGGVTHSFNLIDGLNGLLGGFALIVLSAFSLVAYQAADYTLVMVSLLVMMSILGFLVWNWPSGQIFAGDGGAYLLGYLSATLMVLLVARNPEVSPWFPLVLLGYPVFETLYSIYRRRLIMKTAHDLPDSLHLHQLIFKLMSTMLGQRKNISISANSLSSIPIWIVTIMMAVIAVYYSSNTKMLMWVFLGGVVAYKLTYRILYFLVFKVKLEAVNPKQNGD